LVAIGSLVGLKALGRWQRCPGCHLHQDRGQGLRQDHGQGLRQGHGRDEERGGP